MCSTPKPKQPNIADPLPEPTEVAEEVVDPLAIKDRKKSNTEALTRKREKASLNTLLDGVGLGIPTGVR